MTRNSKKQRRCKGCGELIKGHQGPYGVLRCKQKDVAYSAYIVQPVSPVSSWASTSSLAFVESPQKSPVKQQPAAMMAEPSYARAATSAQQRSSPALRPSSAPPDIFMLRTDVRPPRMEAPRQFLPSRMESTRFMGPRMTTPRHTTPQAAYNRVGQNYYSDYSQQTHMGPRAPFPSVGLNPLDAGAGTAWPRAEDEFPQLHRANGGPDRHFIQSNIHARTPPHVVPFPYDSQQFPWSQHDVYSHFEEAPRVPRPPHYFTRPAAVQQQWPLDVDIRGVRPLPTGTEHLSKKVQSQALAGEFVELVDMLNFVINTDSDELKTVVDSMGRMSVKASKVKRIISSSYKWLEAWSNYENLLCNTYGLSVFNEMMAYRMFILECFQKYKLPFVITYDARHRQLLGARRSFQFSDLEQCHGLYYRTFDLNSVRSSTARCTKCNSTEHTTVECPFRQSGQAADLPKGKKSDRAGDKGSDRGNDKSNDKSSEVCFLYQYGKCNAGGKCKRKHVCISCGGPQGKTDCTKCKQSGNSA